MLLSLAANEGVGHEYGMNDHGMKLDFVDTRKAFFHASTRGVIWPELPKEDAAEGHCLAPDSVGVPYAPPGRNNHARERDATVTGQVLHCTPSPTARPDEWPLVWGRLGQESSLEQVCAEKSRMPAS